MLLSVNYNSNVREFPVILHNVLLIQKLFLNSSILLSITCCLQCVCIFFKSFFMIVILGGIIALSNCSLCLVFHIWQSIVVVNVRTNFVVLSGNDKAEIVNVLQRGVFFLILFVLDFYIFGSDSRSFYFLCIYCKGDLYLLSFHRIYILEILNVFGLSIYIFSHWFLLQSKEAYKVYCNFLASCMRMYFSIVGSMGYVVGIDSKLIAL